MAAPPGLPGSVGRRRPTSYREPAGYPVQHQRGARLMTRSQAQATAADAVGRHEPVLLERCLDLLAPAIEGAVSSTSTTAPARPGRIDCRSHGPGGLLPPA